MKGLVKLGLPGLVLAIAAFRCLHGQAQANVLNGAGWMLVVAIAGGMWLASGKGVQ